MAAICGVRIAGVSAVGAGMRIRLCGGERISYPRELLILAGGALFNLLSVLIPGMGELFYSYSIGAALFNLIPLRGSDGSGIIGALLSMMMPPDAVERGVIIADEISLYFIWCAAIVLNLRGRGSLPLLLAVTFAFIRRMDRCKKYG